MEICVHELEHQVNVSVIVGLQYIPKLDDVFVVVELLRPRNAVLSQPTSRSGNERDRERCRLSLVGPSEMPLLFKNQPTQHRRQGRGAQGKLAKEWVRASGNKTNLKEHNFAKCTLCIGRVLKRVKNFL